MITRVTEGARRERHNKRDTLFFLLVLPPSFLASRGFTAKRSRACTPLTKSDEKERLLAVYEGPVFKCFVIYIVRNFEAGNSLLKRRCNGGHRPTFAVSSDVMDFAMLPRSEIWAETVSLIDVM